MKKKKVLVHGNLQSLQEFLNSPFNRTYEIEAVLTESPVNMRYIQTGVGNIEIIHPVNLPKFIYKFVDGVVLTDKSALNYFLSEGVEPRKIILWDNQGIPEFLKVKQNDVQIFFMEGLQFHIRTQEDAKFFNEWRAFFGAQKKFYALNSSQYKNMIESLYGRKIDWENPKTFTEKIQWLKLYDSTPIKTRLADKYLVRQWVAEKIGAEYLIPLLGVWDNFDDIDFELLPEQFVLKCNHGSGMNVICRDKKTFDVENAREKINMWLEIDFGALMCELHYNNIKKKIIAEKFLTENDLPDINNYKFWCFNGKLNFCGFDSGRALDGNLDNLRIDYFDMNWRPTSFENGSHPRSEHPEKISKPKNFELMKKLAAELCKGFNMVRVDFYEVGEKIYFGEMTFTPGSGLMTFKPAGTDEKLGDLITLPESYEFKQLSR